MCVDDLLVSKPTLFEAMDDNVKCNIDRAKLAEQAERYEDMAKVSGGG